MGILKYSNRIYCLLFCVNVIFSITNAQEKIIDQIIAVIGNDIVLQSELENQVLQIRAQGYLTEGDIYCEVLEELLIQKLLVHQAKVDSVEVNPIQIETELDRRLKYFINQIGSKRKLEEYYNKSLLEIKEDLRDLIAEQLLAQTMQSEILGDIKVTPSEVKKYYNNLPKDSIPYVESELEIRQILLNPPFSDEAIYDVRQKLLDLRKRIIDGESFSTLAILYSEDPGSASNGGELGFVSREELVPEFAKAAIKLKQGGISNIIETEYGYHIIQLIGKEEERINVRHILMKPKIAYKDRIYVMNRLDSISRAIRLDSISFSDAAKKFSEDKKSSKNGGLMVNPMTNSSKFKIDEINRADYFAIKDLKVGEISEPYESINEQGKTVYKIIQLNSKSVPHKANLDQDYNLILNMAKGEKQQEIIRDWIEDKQSQAFIQIDDTYKNCDFNSPGWIKE
ncbi:MAG: peptidylprolyl isomerase [Bacteroidales bacterium]|nr:peptidylprolyl isomerase [Bacteroidales bacterium]